MTTLTETQAPAPRFTHVRAYLVGTGATGALIAGAVIVFLSLATFVAFNGMPFAGNGTGPGSSFVSAQAAAGTPASAAAALRAAPGAVAARPVRGATVGAGAAGAFNGGAGPGGG